MDPRERFLQAAVEPLADNAELQLAARRQLEEQLSPEATGAELVGAAGRMERGGQGRWRWVWAGVVLVASVVMMVGPVGKLFSAWLEARALMAPMMTYSHVEPRLSFRESLSAADRLLLFGDESAPDGADRWRPLWESDPENPMFYIEYAKADYDTLPPDFLATGERLDPGNGWFALKAAASGARDVVEKESLSHRDRKAGKQPGWTVKDEAELARRIELLKQGAMAERIESYQKQLAELRFAKLPRSREFAESIPVLAYMAGMSIDLSEQHLGRLIAAEAQRCEKEGDREGFRELAAAWERLFGRRLDEARTLVEGLVLNVGLGATLPAMSDAAAALEVDADLWKSRADRWQSRREELRTASDGELEERFMRHGSMLAALSLPMVSRQVLDPPPVTRADLLPATRVEQALMARVMAGAGWLLLGIFGLVSLWVGLTQAPLVRRLESGLGRLLNGRDAWWIGGVGVLLPFLIYLGLRYGTPLGRLEWGPRLTMHAVPVSHWVGLLLMWMVWPVAIAEWRSSRCGRVLEWKRPGWWTGSAMVAPVVGMLCFSFAVPPGPRSVPLAGAGVAFGAWSLVWWLARGWAGVFGKREGRVRRRVVARAVRPAWLGAMLAMVGLAFFFHAEERRWFARDEFMRVGPVFTAYEAKVTEQLKAELREVLD